ncbi:hypothetical protein [Streptomyces albireticuli]|nr:hypothetical protein [Streptomyces albireticuli]
MSARPAVVRTECYCVTFPMSTLPVPAAVPRSSTSCTVPKN